MKMLEDLMHKRVDVIEQQIELMLEKHNVEENILKICITDHPEALSVNWTFLNRMTRTEPEKIIKRRIREKM